MGDCRELKQELKNPKLDTTSNWKKENPVLGFPASFIVVIFKIPCGKAQAQRKLLLWKAFALYDNRKP